VASGAGTVRGSPPGLPRTLVCEGPSQAGIAGEDLIAAQLGQALGDDWTLLRGYRNRRGEIDDLLLGPSRHPTVHVGTSTDDVLRLVHDSPGDLGDRQRAGIGRLIHRDHDFHNQARRSGPQDPAGPPRRRPPTRSR
jgi:hypothetical protein